MTDAAGAIVFESGAVGPDGAIVGNDNDADGSLYEIHYDTINRADQVQIYEAILSAVDGRVTTSVLDTASANNRQMLEENGQEEGAETTVTR